ncbi:MAG: hypothetical protein WCT14_11275 [Treponemataceae bacterium]
MDVLGAGVSARRESFALCSGILERGMADGSIAKRDVETLSQSIWVAMFGLSLRLIRETGLSDERRSLLVEETILTLLDGARTRSVGGEKK